MPNEDEVDAFKWKEEKSGKFKVKSVVNYISDHNETVKWSNLVWHLKRIPRYSFIIRLACKTKLATMDRRRKWGVVKVILRAG